MDAETPALTQPQSRPQAAWRRAVASAARPAVLIAVASLLLLGWQWLETRVRLTQLQSQVAQRLAENDAAAQEGRALGRQNQEALQALSIKVGALDAKLAEAQGQQVALDAMYQELSKGRDERLLAEVEQTVAIAAQQLQLAGNVEAALIALQSADQRLARAGHAQFLPLRKLLNRDIDRLKALPLADVPGIALKLEGVIGAIDGLPLAFEQRTRAAPSAAPVAKSGFWAGIGRELWSEMKLMIRIERIDRTEPVLLPPAQSFFLRENLKLRLLDARLALLQHDGRSFREDLHRARDWLVRYFDQRAKPVQSAVATLNALAAADLAVELPTLNDTLASLRNFKLAHKRNDPIPRPGGRGDGGSAGRGGR
ncbi:MAG TPA: uroporphyrinogen-III C-methyltransferase [Rhodocyclaceae bacterium]|nr:uroporphyrinogen-III C-methyltransferase [Rhodocyclaceae bacterium]